MFQLSWFSQPCAIIIAKLDSREEGQEKRKEVYRLVPSKVSEIDLIVLKKMADPPVPGPVNPDQDGNAKPNQDGNADPTPANPAPADPNDASARNQPAPANPAGPVLPVPNVPVPNPQPVSNQPVPNQPAPAVPQIHSSASAKLVPFQA